MSTTTPPVVYKIPWWIVLLCAGVAIWALIIAYMAKNHLSEMSAWNKQMHRWAAHYYYCDSSHRDEAKCAQWSDHIPPPPPPPMY